MLKIQKLFNLSKLTFSSVSPTNTAILELKNFISTLTADDFGIRPIVQNVDKLLYDNGNVTAYCLTVEENPSFIINIFIIPKDTLLPLHGHPGMHVFGTLLCGAARVQVFDIVNERTKLAVKLEERILRAHDTLEVYPNRANIHSIHCLQTCALLDILAPPYKPGVRDCLYYRVKERKGQQAYWLPVQEKRGKEKEQEEKIDRMEEGEGTYLEEIECPPEFECYGLEYNGPRPSSQDLNSE
jgi:cysteamine dioxygenase